MDLLVERALELTLATGASLALLKGPDLVYRAARGEGMHQPLRRRRVEDAVRLIRSSGAGLADVAVDAGFCDQSHMNRAFQAVLGRTPGEVRAEAAQLERFAA